MFPYRSTDRLQGHLCRAPSHPTLAGHRLRLRGAATNTAWMASLMILSAGKPGGFGNKKIGNAHLRWAPGRGGVPLPPSPPLRRPRPRARCVAVGTPVFHEENRNTGTERGCSGIPSCLPVFLMGDGRGGTGGRRRGTAEFLAAGNPWGQDSVPARSHRASSLAAVETLATASWPTPQMCLVQPAFACFQSTPVACNHEP